MERLKGKTALVTGGGRGIGEAIARRFDDEGARVILADIDESSAARVASAIDGTSAHVDVSDASSVSALFSRVREQFEHLDVLVNNAGIGIRLDETEIARTRDVITRQARDRAASLPPSAHLDATLRLSNEAWHEMVRVHLDGTFYCTRAALELMAPRMSGSIINMSSVLGTAGSAGAIHYSAAKAGVLGLTRAVARDVVSRGIRVNAIAPGYVDTDMTAAYGALKPLLVAQTPMGRMGTADEIAWAAVYLASDESAFVTGQVLSPNGGYYMSQ